MDPRETFLSPKASEAGGVAAALEDMLPGSSKDGMQLAEGSMNTVIEPLLSPDIVIKIPKSDVPNAGVVLRREVEVVTLVNESLKGHDMGFPTDIPRVVAYSGDVTSLRGAMLTRVDGTVLSRADIWSRFTVAEYRALGEKVGAFTLGLSQAVDVDTFQRRTGPYNHCIVDRELQLQQIVDETPLYDKLGYPQLARFIATCGRRYNALRHERQVGSSIVIHDDMHPDNLVLKKDEDDMWRLSGVIDFAVAKVGSAERDFRYLATLHPEALQAALEGWRDATGVTLSDELAMLWADIQCAIMCTRGIKRYRSVRPYALRTLEHLHPEVDWRGEFEQASSQATSLKDGGES